MKIFSNHRRKLEPYRRYGSREFQNKLLAAQNYKRSISSDSKAGFFTNFFAKTGYSKLGTMGALAGLAAIVYFLVISPYFRVTNVSVVGANQVAIEDVQTVISDLGKSRLMFVPKNNLFFLSTGRVNKIITKQLPMVKEISSSRTWPNKIKITVKERTPALTLIENSKNYLVDDQGFVIKEIPDTPQMRVIDSVTEDVKTGEQIDGKLIPFIISMKSLWPTKMAVGLSLAKIPGKGSTEVEFVTAEGWSVFFSTDRPVTNQLSNLSLLLAKQIPTGSRTKLAYIDLRISKWAYYCYKQTPCQQTEQASIETSTSPVGPAASGAQTEGSTVSQPDTSVKR